MQLTNTPMKKILIAIDDSPAAEKVAAEAFRLGRRLNAEIALLSVVDTAGLVTDGAVTPAELAEIIKGDLKKLHRTLIAKEGGEDIRSFVEEGKPRNMIPEVARTWEADLIAMGTHGRTGLKHLLMGSVAEHVLRHSALPLFIVPSR